MQTFSLSPRHTLLMGKLSQGISRSEHRNHEQELCLDMLKHKLGKAVSLGHSPSGCPKLYLEAQPYGAISISHSDRELAIVLSNTPQRLGIDIEDLGSQVGRVLNRFTDKEERMILETQENQHIAMHLLWSAKESLFKYLDCSDLNLNTIKAKEIKKASNQTSWLIRLAVSNKTYDVQGIEREDSVLTLIAEENLSLDLSI